MSDYKMVLRESWDSLWGTWDDGSEEAKTSTVEPKENAVDKASDRSLDIPKVEQGRSGVPKLVSSMCFVLQKYGSMHPREIAEQIQKERLNPNSKNLVDYIRYTLSKNKSMFQKVVGQRGRWQVGDVAPSHLRAIEGTSTTHVQLTAQREALFATKDVIPAKEVGANDDEGLDDEDEPLDTDEDVEGEVLAIFEKQIIAVLTDDGPQYPAHITKVLQDRGIGKDVNHRVLMGEVLDYLKRSPTFKKGDNSRWCVAK